MKFDIACSVLLFLCTALVFKSGQGQHCPTDCPCPASCFCREQYSQCTSGANISSGFPLNTRRLRFTQLNFRDLPPRTFDYLKNLTKIEFINCNIANVHGCSFTDLPSIKTIFFNQTVFGNIEEYAFSNLKNLDLIHISKSRIGRLKPFAFYNIHDVDKFIIDQTHIRNFYTHGMYDLSNMSMMILSKNNFSDFVTGALTKVRNIKKVEFMVNSIWNMHCGVLDDIFNIHNQSLVFFANTFYCNCSINWMLNSAGSAKYGLTIEKSSCHGPDNLNNTALSSLKFNQLGCKTIDASDKLHCRRPQVTPKLKCAVLVEEGLWQSPNTEDEKKKTDQEKSSSNCVHVLLTSIIVTMTSIFLLV